MTWPRVRLGEVVDFSQGIQVSVEDQYDQPGLDRIRFVRIVDYTSKNQEPARYISNPGDRYIVNDSAVVMIRYGSQTAGKVARGISGAIANNTFKVTPKNKSQLSNDFLYHFLSQPAVYLHFQNAQSSSTMPAITFDLISKLEIQLPAIDVQNIISEALNLFDSKIKNNNQINENLHLIANTVFKEWFIDFGPVKSKANGGIPLGMDEATAVFFPDSLENSELGMIPKGWKINSYSSQMKQIKINVNPSQLGIENCLHYSLPNYDSIKYPKSESVSEIKSNKFKVPHSSILFSKLNPINPRIWIPVHTENQNEQAIGSTEFVVIAPLSQDSRWLCYCLLNNPTFLERMAQTATGTSNSHQRIRPDAIFETSWVSPSKDVIQVFNKTVSSIFEQILNNQKEIQDLSLTRDLILPKLISGEIELKDLNV